MYKRGRETGCRQLSRRLHRADAGHSSHITAPLVVVACLTDAMFPLSLISVSEYCSNLVFASMNSTSGRASPFTNVFFSESAQSKQKQSSDERADA